MTWLLPMAALMQGGGELRQDLRNAVSELRVERVETAAERLVQANSVEAAESILQGCALLHDAQASLERTQLKLSENERKIFASFQDSRDENERKELLEQLAELDRQLSGVRARLARAAVIEARLDQALAELTDPRASAFLLDRLQNSGEWSIRQAVALALGMSPHGVFEQVSRVLLERFRKERVPNVRVAIIEALRRRRDKRSEVGEALREALAAEHWQVASAAAAMLAEIEDRGAIEPLIQLAGRSDGRLRWDATEALTRVTGLKRGPDAAAWRAWWQGHHEDFLRGAYAPTSDDRVEPTVSNQFYGLPVRSRNVAFLLDRSGSMSEEVEYRVTDDDRSVESQLKPAGRTKLDVARFQLKKALLRLPAGSRFNIIVYNQQPRMYSEQGATIDDKSRRKAFEFLDSARPAGGTNLNSALEAAFALAREPDGVLRPDGIDTVYLLSDGLPTAGEEMDAGRILARVSSLNLILRLEIHTVYTGTDGSPGQALMRDLARRNFGQSR